jgi:hypothetical protein
LWHKTYRLTQKGTSGSHFELKDRKRGQFKIFLVQKVLVLRLFQKARHEVDISTRKGKQPGSKKKVSTKGAEGRYAEFGVIGVLA